MGAHCQHVDITDTDQGRRGCRRESKVGLPSLSPACSQHAVHFLHHQLWGKDIFGSDFRLSLSKIVGDISQAGLLTAASFSGHQRQVMSSEAVFLTNAVLYLWILFFKRQNTRSVVLKLPNATTL